MHAQECPNCGSHSTNKEMMKEYGGEIQVVRTCEDCPTQYTLGYGNPVVMESTTVEE